MFTAAQTYRRLDLHEKFGGQRQGGISTPVDAPFILVFTGEAGEAHGYHDGWTASGIFNYTGEGQMGDMQLVRGNGALARASRDGTPVHLFSYVRKGLVRYVGEMRCTGYHEDRGPDTEGRPRRRFIFELTPVSALEEEIEAEDDPTLTIDELRQLALADSAESRDAVERLASVRKRSLHVKLYARRRAAGRCESCQAPAPFIARSGEPFLEVHHILRLSDGGPDEPAHVAAVCPNCHRKAHLSADVETMKARLLKTVGQKEAKLRL